MYSYLYALIKKSEFGPIIARVKPRRGMLVDKYLNKKATLCMDVRMGRKVDI